MSQILWGVNGHAWHYPAYRENMDEALRLAAELGCKIYRINYRPTNEEQMARLSDYIDRIHALGMKVLLVLDYSMNYSGTMEELAAAVTYIGESLRDKVDYFQMFNETDCWACRDENGYYDLTDTTGQSPSFFNPVRVKRAVELMKAALPALQKAAPGVPVCVNISVRHYPILDWYREAGLEWDIIGIDNYEEWDYHEFFRFVKEHYKGYGLMVVECNYPALWGPFDDPDKKEAEWLQMFLPKMEEYGLESDHLKAVIIYELLDQPIYEQERGAYHGESHFGLVSLDESNQIVGKKPAFDVAKEFFHSH